MTLAALSRDPRHYQIGALCLFLAYGLLSLDFEFAPLLILTIVASALCVQWIGDRLILRRSFDPRSALISSLSLCLLLRTDLLVFGAVAAGLAIASKFTVRWRGKHLFNPTNFALVVLLLTSDGVWVSPGQWGHLFYFTMLAVCLAGLVLSRARRADISLGFLGCYAGLLIARAVWLGDPLSIPLHQMQHGALLVFAFFMISDPKTTPNSRYGRLLFAAVVSVVAAYLQFHHYETNGLLYALVLCAPLTPLLDRLLPAAGYHWAGAPQLSDKQETPHASEILPARRV